VQKALDENNVSWRVGVDYKPVQDTLLYVNASRGFKAGGFPVIAAPSSLQFTPAVQEELTAYEAGFKSTLAEETLNVSGAAFYYDYKNKQIRGLVVVPIFGPQATLVNIPQSQVLGGELNMQWLPVKGLNIGAGVSYIDSKIGNYSGYDVFGKVIDLDGTSFPNAPALQVRTTFQYDRALTGSMMSFVGGDYSYTSSTYGTMGKIPEMKLPSYGLLGVRAGVYSDDNRWRFWLWGRNVTNKFYLTGANLIGGDVLGNSAGLPRTYGASMTYNF